MGLIKKTVTGNTNDLKLVQNGKNVPKAAGGGTERPSFTGSNDKRSAGSPNRNVVLQEGEGYINQGSVTMGDVSFSRKWTETGKRGSAAGKATVMHQDVTSGMGGKFFKEPGGF